MSILPAQLNLYGFHFLTFLLALTATPETLLHRSIQLHKKALLV